MLIRSRCCHMFTSCLDTKGVEVFRNVQRRPTLRGLPICVCPTGQQEFQCSIVTKVRGDMYCIDLFGRHKDAAIAQDRNIYVLLIHKAQHPHLLEANHRSEMTGLILPYIYEFTCLHRIYIYMCYASSYNMNILWVFPITMTGLPLGPNVKTPRRFCPQTELQQFASDVSLWAKSEAFDWPQANRCHREHVGNSHQATNRPRDPIDLQQPPVSRSLCEGSKWSPLQSFKLEKMVAPNRSIWRPWAAEIASQLANWQVMSSRETLITSSFTATLQRSFFLILNIAVLTKSHLHLHRQSWLRHIRRISDFTCHSEKSKFLNYNFLSKWLLRRLAGHLWFLVINHNGRPGTKRFAFQIRRVAAPWSSLWPGQRRPWTPSESWRKCEDMNDCTLITKVFSNQER